MRHHGHQTTIVVSLKQPSRGQQDGGEEKLVPETTGPQPRGRELPPPPKTVVDRTRPQSTPVPARSGQARLARKAPPRGHTNSNRVRPSPRAREAHCHAATGRPLSLLSLHRLSCVRCRTRCKTGRLVPTRWPRSGPLGPTWATRAPIWAARARSGSQGLIWALPSRASLQRAAAATTPPAEAEPSPPDVHRRQEKGAPPPPLLDAGKDTPPAPPRPRPADPAGGGD